MATLRDIKQRISGVQKTQQITRALKMVAAGILSGILVCEVNNEPS
jgi:formate/nitrite transporter FocA (FNT family)